MSAILCPCGMPNALYLCAAPSGILHLGRSPPPPLSNLRYRHPTLKFVVVTPVYSIACQPVANELMGSMYQTSESK